MTWPIQAMYAVNEYINTQLTNVSLPTQTFSPGSFGTPNVGDNYIVYSVMPSTGVNFWMMHTDSFKYNLYNTDFDILQKIAGTINQSLNVDIIQGLINESGVKFLFTHIQPTGDAENIYVEGNNYLTLTFIGSLVYTLP